MAHYVGVVHRKMVEIARERGVVAFGHGKESLVRSLEVGDSVIFYAPREEPDGAPVQAFVALAEVTGAEPRESDFYMGRTGWLRDARFLMTAEVPVKPMLEDLTFVKNKTHWGMTFRGGRFRIPGEDHARIVAAMEASA